MIKNSEYYSYAIQIEKLAGESVLMDLANALADKIDEWFGASPIIRKYLMESVSWAGDKLAAAYEGTKESAKGLSYDVLKILSENLMDILPEEEKQKFIEGISAKRIEDFVEGKEFMAAYSQFLKTFRELKAEILKQLKEAEGSHMDMEEFARLRKMFKAQLVSQPQMIIDDPETTLNPFLNFFSSKLHFLNSDKDYKLTMEDARSYDDILNKNISLLKHAAKNLKKAKKEAEETIKRKQAETKQKEESEKKEELSQKEKSLEVAVWQRVEQAEKTLFYKDGQKANIPYGVSEVLSFRKQNGWVGGWAFDLDKRYYRPAWVNTKYVELDWR